MGILTREQILGIENERQEIHIPEWKGSVFIRSLTLAEQAKISDIGNKYEKASFQDRMRNITLRVIQWAASDGEGNPIFGPDDVDKILNKPSGGYLRLQEAIVNLSGFTKESREILEKNSQGDLSASPGSV